MSAEVDRYGNPLPQPPSVPEHARDWEELYDAAFPSNEPKDARTNVEYMASRIDALEQLKGILRKEAVRRSLQPQYRPIYQGGELVGYEAKFDNRHLAFVAERLLPEEFNLAHRLSRGEPGGETIKLVITPDDGEEIVAEDGAARELGP